MCRFLWFEDVYDEVKDSAREALAKTRVALARAGADLARAQAAFDRDPHDPAAALMLAHHIDAVAALKRLELQNTRALGAVVDKQLRREARDVACDADVLQGAPLVQDADADQTRAEQIQLDHFEARLLKLKPAAHVSNDAFAVDS